MTIALRYKALNCSRDYSFTLLGSSVAVLETLAARKAVCFAQEIQLRSSVIEGDSEVSISAIKNKCFSHPSCGHIIRDILSLTSSFQNFSFSRTLRQGKALSHALAKTARMSFSVVIWTECVPLDVFKFYVSDCLAIK